MKNYLFLLIFSLFFVACSTKVEQSVEKSNQNDISELLKKLIQKEKEINILKLELKDCKEKNKE
jgi:uncharacterized protein YcfL